MDQKFIGAHISAVDFRILALTNLLIKKGIITEKEVQSSYEEIFKVMTNLEEVPESEKEELSVFLKNFFQLD